MILSLAQLAAYVRQLRTDRDISVNDMAVMTGMTVRSIHRGERGLQLSATIAIIIAITRRPVEERTMYTANRTHRSYHL